jgi:hypothetical protein
MSKIRVGIDINEILRARWLQFDRYYVEEFGEEGVPKVQPYVYNFFENYKWNQVVEKIKELKEPEDTPDINPIDYQTDKNGDAAADIFLFKEVEESVLSPKQVYNRFMFEDYVYEIHGSAPLMYRGIDKDVKDFYLKYGNDIEIVVLSVENFLTIPSTLFFLSKLTSRFKEYRFVDKSIDMWKHVDVLITTDPDILNLGTPWFKKLIKVKRPYNQEIKTNSLEVLHIKELIDNKEFEKIIKYKTKK